MPLAWLNEFRVTVKKQGNDAFTAKTKLNGDRVKSILSQLELLAPKGYPEGSWWKLLISHEPIQTDNGETFTWEEAVKDDYFRKYRDTVNGVRESVSTLFT